VKDADQTTAKRSSMDQRVSTIIGYLRSTSKRDFIVIPIAVLVEQMLSRRKTRLAGLPLMAWGYLQYRISGDYRNSVGGGGPGISGPPPERLVTSGIYGLTRNPMYTGHVIFLAGLVISTSSPFALAATIGTVPWLRSRILRDEQRLTELFGKDYEDYAARVTRWGIGPVPNAAWSDTSSPSRHRS